MRRTLRRAATYVALVLATLAMLFAFANPAGAHGFTTVVYVDATSPEPNQVRVKLGMEYDLTVASVATYEKDDALFREGQPAWDDGDYPGMVKALQDHPDSLFRYITQRFGISAAGIACSPSLVPGYKVALNENQGVPYLTTTLDYTCPDNADADVLHQGHVIRSALFPDSEQFIKGAKTIVAFNLDGRSGSVALDSSHPSFSTKESWWQRSWSFYHLGLFHILTGPDHLLFLTALIIGSRRVREVVLGATTFTVAHGVTLILAAFGVVHVSPNVSEPLIALSIAGVAAWYLWRLWFKRSHAGDIDTSSTSHFALDRAGWGRLAIVFGFGLVHGLGFAGALGIDHAWSWTLLVSLLVFSVGIETVQLGLIVLIFPALTVLRHRKPIAALWVTGVIAAAVSLIGLVWFVQRVVSGPGPV
ncbi:HupE/UreJ family protein [Jatrophihabitans sp. DSM 45814]